MFLFILSLLVLATVILMKQTLNQAHSYVPIRVDDVKQHRNYKRRRYS